MVPPIGRNGGGYSMKAAVLHGKCDLRYEEVPTPVPGPGQVRIAVRYTGVCGSDIPRVLGNGAHFFPLILGHEFSGVVEALGEGVVGYQAGDAVSAAPLIPCHSCEVCKRGLFAQCKKYSFVGSRQNGSWAEYVVVPQENVVKLDASIDHLAGAFMEPLTVALHGLYLMNFRPGVKTVIIGMGTIGLLALQAAKKLGAGHVTVMDIDAERLEIAKSLGADAIVNSMQPDAVNQLMALTEGSGGEMVIETAGAPAAEILALQTAAAHGSVMFIGTPSRPLTLEPSQFELINRKELTVRGSWMSYSAPFPGEEWKMAAQYLTDGSVKVQPLLDRIVGFEDAWKAFEDIRDGIVKGKVMLRAAEV